MNKISHGQELFLSRLRRHRLIVRLARILILVLFLILWEVCADTGIIDSFIFSSPSKIALCFREMVTDRSIFLHIGVTLYETIVSFLLVTLFSILLAVLLWCSRKLSEILEPYLVVLNSLPKSALAPLLIVWLGATPTTIIVAGMSVAIFGSIMNLYTSFTTVDREKIKLILTMFPGTEQMKIRCADTGKLLGTPCLVHDALVQELEELLGRENVAVR